VFFECLQGEYDVVLAMSHDQRNIAQKTHKLEGIVNASSIFNPRGVLRCGVSHGTAYNIVRKGIAKHDSMLSAIKTAASFAAGNGFPDK
jgi:4-hydroxythreonine-4-phosphate dehydrogenase